MTSLIYTLMLLPAILFSCGDEFDEKDDLAQLAALKKEILSLAGEADCSGIGECKLLPLGAKPCGGPWEYLIYSTAGTDSMKIREKVDEHNKLNEVINKRYGYMSDCMVVEPPILVCVNGKCVDGNKAEGGRP